MIGPCRIVYVAVVIRWLERLIARLTLVIFRFNANDIYSYRIVVDKSQTNEDILRIDQMIGPCSNLTALFMAVVIRWSERLITRLTLVIFRFNANDIYSHRIVVDKSQTNEDILRTDQMIWPCSNLTALFM